MDIARPASVARNKRMRQLLYGAAALVAVASVSIALSRLQPAAPLVERDTVWEDTVRRGPMLRQVRGIGTLVPEDIRWIPATTNARVEAIILWPGTKVDADSIILELDNPQLEQELQDAELSLRSAEASLANLRVQVQNDLLKQRAAAAEIEADYSKAKMQVEMNEALARDELVSALVLRQSRLDADQLAVRHQIAQEQLASFAESGRAQITVAQSAVDQARAMLALRQRQSDELHVRAGLSGVLQVVPVEVGQQVAPGTNLARVANPAKLKAEIRIAETQATDIEIGQSAEIDTRAGVVSGLVTRIDPSVQNGTRTVDVSLDGELPRGAVPDLSVDGTILLERMDDVLFVGRPAFGQEQQTVQLFKFGSDGSEASRVQVTLGRSSVNTVEILEGLDVGDRVILSDMSSWDSFDRVRVR
ncbi:MAG: efflux RND transporter periplasmic adaptor subunit [Vicinamibacterales bacterium]